MRQLSDDVGMRAIFQVSATLLLAFSCDSSRPDPAEDSGKRDSAAADTPPPYVDAGSHSDSSRPDASGMPTDYIDAGPAHTNAGVAGKAGSGGATEFDNRAGTSSVAGSQAPNLRVIEVQTSGSCAVGSIGGSYEAGALRCLTAVELDILGCRTGVVMKPDPAAAGSVWTYTSTPEAREALEAARFILSYSQPDPDVSDVRMQTWYFCAAPTNPFAWSCSSGALCPADGTLGGTHSSTTTTWWSISPTQIVSLACVP
jgi:hypothetical protein